MADPSDSPKMDDTPKLGTSTATMETTTGPLESGERVTPRWSSRWIEVGHTFPPHTKFAPAKIATSNGRHFAALHLILSDLSFAHDALVAANKIGLPDSEDLNSRGLIFSGVVA